MTEIYTDSELEPKQVRHRPPMVGVLPPPVGKRPRCPGCDRELRPYLRNVYAPRPPEAGDGIAMLHPEARQWTGGYHGYLEFCGSTCAARYAIRVVRIVLPVLPVSEKAKAAIRESLIRRPEPR